MFHPIHQQYPTTQQPPSPPRDIMHSLPPNTVMTTNAAGEQKPRKLRASCDACSRAKVKCDKVRPTCHRCGNMGICCNYSPSMRLGKPRKNRNPDGSIMREASPAHLGARPDMIPRTNACPQSTTESSPEPSDPFLYGPATPEFNFNEPIITNGFDGSNSPFSDTGSFVSNWTNDDHLMFQSPTDVFTSMPQFPPSSAPYAPLHHRTTSTHSQPEMYSHSLSHSPPLASSTFFSLAEQTMPIFATDKMTSPQPSLPAPLPTPPASATLQNHDCTKVAFQTLNNLYSPAATCFNGTSNGRPSLDVVLSTNKAAVDKLFVLLGCPCSSNPHFSTTIVFTITKILSWYQAIAAGEQSYPDSPVNIPTESFIRAPTSYSEWKPEGEVEATYRTQLVLGELRKVEKLIDKFQERYCNATNAAETGIDGGVYISMESLLRTRVRDTFKCTMKAAPKEVKRQIVSQTQMQRARTSTL